MSNLRDRSRWFSDIPVAFVGGKSLFLYAASCEATVMASRTGFQRMSRTSRGCVTLCCRLLVIVRLLHLVVLVLKNVSNFTGGVTLWCRLLVIVQSLCLVVLVFEECLELHGGVLLFAVGCWLLCDHYVWSYWFSTPPCMYCCCFSYLKSYLLFVQFAWLVAMVSWLSTEVLGYIMRRKFFHFPIFWWSPFYLVFCAFVAGERSAACWVILK